MDLYEYSQSYLDEASISSQNKNKANYRKSYIMDFDVEQLYNARDRLKEFAHEIGSLKSYNIRRDVICHCDRLNFIPSFQLPFEKVEKMVRSRIQRMIKNRRIKRNWSNQDIIILIWVVSKYSDMKGLHNVEKQLIDEDWKFIAELIPGVLGHHCMFKWFSLKKYNLANNSWTERQSELLRNLIKNYGEEDWHVISEELYFRNKSSNKIYRSPKQCREHWNCYLNPNLKKGPWSTSEDELLLRSIQKNNGQKKWAQMVKFFNGRTENALKNRFTLIIEKEKKNNPSFKKKTQCEIIEKYFEKLFVEEIVNVKADQEKHQPHHLKRGCNKAKSKISTSYGLRNSSHPKNNQNDEFSSDYRFNFQNNDHDNLDKRDPIKKQENSFVFNSVNLGSELIPNVLEEHFSSFGAIKRENMWEHSSWKRYEPELIENNQQQENYSIEQKAENINIQPLNIEMFNFENFGNHSFYPCVLVNNKLHIVDQQ